MVESIKLTIQRIFTLAFSKPAVVRVRNYDSAKVASKKRPDLR